MYSKGTKVLGPIQEVEAKEVLQLALDNAGLKEDFYVCHQSGTQDGGILLFVLVPDGLVKTIHERGGFLKCGCEALRFRFKPGSKDPEECQILSQEPEEMEMEVSPEEMADIVASFDSIKEEEPMPSTSKDRDGGAQEEEVLPDYPDSERTKATEQSGGSGIFHQGPSNHHHHNFTIFIISCSL